MAALYLQVSIVSQALIFVTRSRSWFFVERPGLLLVGAFIIAQLVSILFQLILNSATSVIPWEFNMLSSLDRWQLSLQSMPIGALQESKASVGAGLESSGCTALYSLFLSTGLNLPPATFLAEKLGIIL